MHVISSDLEFLEETKRHVGSGGGGMWVKGWV